MSRVLLFGLRKQWKRGTSDVLFPGIPGSHTLYPRWGPAGKMHQDITPD